MPHRCRPFSARCASCDRSRRVDDTDLASATATSCDRSRGASIGSDAGAHNNLGVLYYNKGMYEDAVAAFARALELDPKMQVAQRNLEVAYFQHGLLRSPRRGAARQAARASGRSRRALGARPRLRRARRRRRRRSRSSTRSCSTRPNDIGAIVQLGLAEKANGDLEKAQCWLERALALDPTRARSCTQYIGEVLYNRGLNDQALDALRRVDRALTRERRRALPASASCSATSVGTRRRARRRSARSSSTRRSRARRRISRSIATTRARYNELVPERQERRSTALELSTDGQLAHYNLGLAFRQKGYYAEALREYKLALERGRGSRISCCRRWPRCICSRRMRRRRSSCTTRFCSRRQDSPEALVRARRRAASAGAARGGGRELSSRAASSIRRTRSRTTTSASRSITAATTEGAVDSFRAALVVAAELREGAAQPRAAAVPREAVAARARGVSPGAHARAGAAGGVERRRARARGAQEVRGRAQRVRRARFRRGPSFAEAHYNLGFTLSNLGDFEGALRATKRALELDPYYTPQKFELAIDVEYEDPDLSIAPELGGGERTASERRELRLRHRSTRFAVHAARACDAGRQSGAGEARRARGTGRAALRARARLSREGDARSRGRSRRIARWCAARRRVGGLRDPRRRSSCAQGLLRRGARAISEARATRRRAEPKLLAGETRALLALDRVVEARVTAEALLDVDGGSVEALLLTAAARARAGDPAAARELLRSARAPRPSARGRAQGVRRRRAARGRRRRRDRGVSQRARPRSGLRRRALRARAAAAPSAASPRRPSSRCSRRSTRCRRTSEAMLALANVRRRFGRVDAALPPLVELLRRDPYNIDALLSLARGAARARSPRRRGDLDRSRAALRSAPRARAVPQGAAARRPASLPRRDRDVAARGRARARRASTRAARVASRAPPPICCGSSRSRQEVA